MYIEYGAGKLTIKIWEPKPEGKLKHLFYDLAGHFKLKNPLYIRVFNVSYTAWPFAVLLGTLSWMWTDPSPELRLFHIYLICIASVVFIISLALKYFLSFLYLDRKHGVENFWKRNKDRIILLILGVVFGAFAKWFFDKFF